MPILKSYQIIKKVNDSIKCLDVIHVEKTDRTEILFDLVPKLIYGESEINWKYALGGFMRKS